jgi:hypothetical protein
MRLTPEEELRVFGCLFTHAENAVDAMAEAEQLAQKLEAVSIALWELKNYVAELNLDSLYADTTTLPEILKFLEGTVDVAANLIDEALDKCN